MNYTVNKNKTQGRKPLNCVRTHYNCKPHARCKQIHKCDTCHQIHATKQLNKHLGHIKDKQLKKFKYAKYITITSKNLVNDFELYNDEIDEFNNYLTSSDKRRFKKHPFYNSEYITFKEITKSKGNKNLFPHLHIILLTNNDNLFFDNPYFDYDIRDIEIDLDHKYKNDYRNPLTQTLKKIYAYSSKVDKSRLSYERTFNTSKGKSDIKISSIFKTKPKKSHVLIPIHIEIVRNIRKQCRQGRKLAIAQHQAYKQQKGNINNIQVHKHALLTKRKLQRLEAQKITLLERAEKKLKAVRLRGQRIKIRTHTIN